MQQAELEKIKRREEGIRVSQASGLSALPQSWIPLGKTRGVLKTSVADADIEVDRTEDRLVLDATNPVYPDLTCTDLGQGKVKLLVDMPWPVKDVSLSGPMLCRGQTVLLEDERSDGKCELTQPQPGQVRGTISRAGEQPIGFVYEARVADSRRDPRP